MAALTPLRTILPGGGITDPFFNPLPFPGGDLIPSLNLTGGAAGPAISGGNPLFNDRNYINIAPTGVNLGEIFRNFEGPPENGGAGLERGNLFVKAGLDGGLVGATIGGESFPLIVILIAGGLVLALFLGRRRG